MTSYDELPLINGEDLKRWGCRNWSDEEREELAFIANKLQLREPAGGRWPELQDAFRADLG